MVALEINQKYDWTVILAANRGIWQIRQNLNGSPQLYYAQNKLFHSIATALGQGNKDTAWQLISQNLPLYPDCADLYYYRGLYWQLGNDPQKSRADLLVALALDNHFHSAAHALAALYLESGELAEALDWLKLLNDEKPDDLDVQNNLAACEAGLGNTERAVEIWNAILKIAPNYELARKNLERYQR
ncbi:MAG: tetratricopeptide repeat protein [Candidatus Cloacimonetes bacterium]|nr:tetratricopeptide repeat protein [Candidatus Cloacimonadota bacterium]